MTPVAYSAYILATRVPGVNDCMIEYVRSDASNGTIMEKRIDGTRLLHIEPGDVVPINGWKKA